MSDRIVHFLPLPQQVGLLRTACGLDLTDPELTDHDVATDREGVTCEVCLVTISDPAAIQQVRDQGLPRLVEVETSDGGTLKIGFDHWIAWVLGQALREGLDAAGAVNSLEYVFPEAEGSADRVTVVVTAIRPGSKSPTDRLRQAESDAQDHLTTLARIAVWLEQGERDGAQAEFEAAWFARAQGWAEALQRARLALGDDTANGQSRPAWMVDLEPLPKPAEEEDL